MAATPFSSSTLPNSSANLPPAPQPLSPSQSPSLEPSPSSILIVGSGVFGLGTAWALARRNVFANTRITVVDRSDLLGGDAFPAPDAASNDTSRIIRADYADPAYAALCAEAQVFWRQQSQPDHLGAQGRYSESGLIVVSDAPPAPNDPTPVAEGEAAKDKLTSMDYVRRAWANVLVLTADDPALAGSIRELPNSEAVRDAVSTGGTSGVWGYLNKTSGWADATAATAWLLRQVQATGRVNFIAGSVASLEHDGASVTGARLSDGRLLSADLVIVAAGAWTEALVDLGGQAVATGQVLGYLHITQEEQDQLSKMPVLLSLSSGHFVMPPSERVLKIARHAYGYTNPTTLATPSLPLSPHAVPPTTASLPRTHLDSPPLSAAPAEGADDLRRALRDMVPGLQDRPFFKTRLCWYMDTPTADFVVDYHPGWKGLFVATGDSGHAFKFLPVLGDKIVDCITGHRPPEFAEKWAWKQGSGVAVITEDGSRGGERGLILSDELEKGVLVHPTE